MHDDGRGECRAGLSDLWRHPAGLLTSPRAKCRREHGDQSDEHKQDDERPTQAGRGDSAVGKAFQDPGVLLVYQTGPLTVVGFAGKDVPDEVCIAGYRDQMIKLIEEHQTQIMAVDLSGVRLVPSGMLGLLTSIRKKVQRVELYNPSSRSVSLAGYSLRYRTSTGTFSTMVAFASASTATIAPHGYFLVASARNNANCPGSYTGNVANTVAADATFVVQLSGSEASVWLTKADANPAAISDAIVVDVVGYGTPDAFEGTAIGAPAAGGAIERKANATSTTSSMAAAGADVTAGNGYDTDDNSTNFVQQVVRVPQNTSSTAEP